MLTPNTRLAVRWTTDPAAPDYVGTPRMVLAYLADLDRRIGGAAYRVSVRRCSDGEPVTLITLRNSVTLAEARRKGWAL